MSFPTYYTSVAPQIKALRWGLLQVTDVETAAASPQRAGALFTPVSSVSGTRWAIRWCSPYCPQTEQPRGPDSQTQAAGLPTCALRSLCLKELRLRAHSRPSRINVCAQAHSQQERGPESKGSAQEKHRHRSSGLTTPLPDNGPVEVLWDFLSYNWFAVPVSGRNCGLEAWGWPARGEAGVNLGRSIVVPGVPQPRHGPVAPSFIQSGPHPSSKFLLCLSNWIEYLPLAAKNPD